MIIDGPEKLTPTVLTEILQRSGTLPERSRVTDVQFKPIGVGMIGDTMRFAVTYEGEAGDSPQTFAGKFAAKDPTAHQTGAELGLYMTETRFYEQYAAQLPVRAPRCYFAQIDPRTQDFCVLLEDVSPARAVDQIEGCSLLDAEHAMRQAAALHAPYFGDTSLWSVEWMQPRKRIFGAVAQDFASHMAVFRERYSDILEPEYMEIADRFAAKATHFVTCTSSRISLVHADFRLDNMLFDAKGGAVPLVVLDWQSVAPENPGIDTAYFLGTSYPIERRRNDEGELLRLYHDEMQVQGVRNYSLEDVHEDYRRGAWLGLFTAIFSSAVAKRTERGDRVFVRLAQGAAAQMRDSETLTMV